MLRTPLSNTAEHTIHKHIKHLWNSLQCILHDTRCYLNVRSKADIIYRTANDDILNKSLTTHDYLQTVHRFSCAHQIKHQRATTAFHRSVKHWNSLMNFHTHACSNQNTVSVKASNGAHLKVEQWNSLTISLLAHTHPFNGLWPGLPRWAGTRKVKPVWILLKQETVSGSGISWAICKSAPRSRQITLPAPHHSVVYRPDALPATQPTVSKHWRQLPYYSYRLQNVTSTIQTDCSPVNCICANTTKILAASNTHLYRWKHSLRSSWACLSLSAA